MPQTSQAALLDAYEAALARSRLLGQHVRFVVDIGPKGESRFGPIEEEAPQADDLEAALAAARARGRVLVADILDGEDMLSAEAFAAMVGTSRVTVNDWRRKHRVLALEGAKRGFRFPAWQVGADGKPFPALPALFDRLGGDAWSVYRFLVQHHPELDGLTGRQALQRGRSDAAIEAAESTMRAFG